MIRSSGVIGRSAAICRRFTPMLAWVSITPLGRLVVPLGVGQHRDVLGGVDGDLGHRAGARQQLLHAAVALDLVAGPHRPVAGGLDARPAAARRR